MSSSGLYTAGATAGSFTVKATSVQDSTKSATAAITITAPQPVGVDCLSDERDAIHQRHAAIHRNGNERIEYCGNVVRDGRHHLVCRPLHRRRYRRLVYGDGDQRSGFVQERLGGDHGHESTRHSGAHPRIILDAPTLATLRTRMQANTAEWTDAEIDLRLLHRRHGSQFINGKRLSQPPERGRRLSRQRLYRRADAARPVLSDDPAFGSARPPRSTAPRASRS